MSDLVVERRGPVTVLRIDRADRHNTIGGTLLRELVEAFEAAERDGEVRALVTTGAGSTFCVGADLPELLEGLAEPTADLLNGTSVGGDKGLPALSPDQRLLEQRGVGRWSERIAACTKPTVAALNGATAGGGLALAVAHDFRVAAESATLKAGFLSVGAAPEMGVSHLLPRLVGWRAAREILLRDRTLPAGRALELGLVDEVVPDKALLERALGLAGELAARPAMAYRVTQRLLAESADNGWHAQLVAEYQAQLLLFGLPETRTALAALCRKVVRDG